MRVPLALSVNEQPHELQVDTRTTLVQLLREELHLTGTHIGCTTGNCGACTVLLDRITVKSCCVLAADTAGQRVTTIEHVSSNGGLHPIQAAFVQHQGLQCGFCTPGMILSTLYLLEQTPDPTEAEVRHAIAGNLCRCTGYKFIVESVLDAARRLRTNGGT
jgi:carbon-monoxide dehydrogenase small subunit